MLTNRLTTLATVVLLALSAGTSCVERTETITIARDGAVIIELEYEGTEEELARGDAMPSAETGWNVARETKKDGDDVEVVLKSKRRFEPGDPLPSTFAAADDPDADLYLEFPTTVRMERRRDGTYYYFHRVYTPRPWAYVRHWEDKFFDDNIKKLTDKPVEELTFGDRIQIVEAFAGFEAFKQIEFAKIALEESNPDLPVEQWLIARRALIGFYEEELEVYEQEGVYSGPIVDTIEFCERLPEDEKDKCFDEEARCILAAGYDALVRSLRHDTGLAKWQMATFEEAYTRAERHYKITEQLGGHVFGIDVVMPGTIIAHNAIDGDVEVDPAEEGSNTSGVTFTFEGNWFRDRPYEIVVVSRLEHERQRR